MLKPLFIKCYFSFNKNIASRFVYIQLEAKQHSSVSAEKHSVDGIKTRKLYALEL
ncbi:MAG: hypothetical protein ACTSR8_10410 [Promethearchaeota archaeon]